MFGRMSRVSERNTPVPVLNQHSSSSAGFNFRSLSQWISRGPTTMEAAEHSSSVRTRRPRKGRASRKNTP